MVAVYESFSSEEFLSLVSKYGQRLIVQPTAGQLCSSSSVLSSAVKFPGGVELKARDFRPSDMGQLEFYLEALDRDVRRQNENPSIGILLCKSADRSVVEYALSRTMSPAMDGFYLWDAIGTYEDEKTGKAKTYKYKTSFPVSLKP